MRVLLVASTVMHTDNDGMNLVAEQAGYVPWYNPYEEIPSVNDHDELAEFAGRLCYESWGRPNPDTATNAGYIANIIKQQHYSVLEHSSATFFLDGVTRNFTHELIRHRHLSFSEVSQRYVDVSEFPFAWHPGFQDLSHEDAVETLEEVGVLKSLYQRFVDTLTGQGIERKKARQTARHILPGGLETRILVTGNMRAWREVLEKRLSPTADEEFRQVAQKILAELQKIAPNTFQDFA